MNTILTIGCEIPGGLGKCVEFNSKTSLLDADFVLFCPNLGDYDPNDEYHGEYYKGKPLLTDTSSFQLQEVINCWKRELNDFLSTGKTVFVIMSGCKEVYVRTGEEEYSILNRHRLMSNYDVLPFSIKIFESKGASMKLHPHEDLLREYWQQFGDESEYHVHIEESESFRPLVYTRQGGRIVGGIFQYKNGGTLVALPWINFHKEEFKEYGERGYYVEEGYEEGYYVPAWTWTSKAMGWREKYLKTLESLDKAVRSQNETTPTPQWALDDKFRANQETALSKELIRIQTKISDLEKKREKIREKLADAGSLKGLLFEKGYPLENAILEAMRLMGFVANTYRDSDSEFDVVLECDEGRCIGEVEGRDNKPISIAKMRQLSDNIHEDFSRDEVSELELAKGILLGNAYRLSPPSDRPAEHFTAKCIKAGKRNGTALIRTCDLFEVAKALVDEPDDEFAAACREAIFNTVGEEVRFPTHPKAEAYKSQDDP